MMEQIYVNFRQSSFVGKRNKKTNCLEGINEKSLKVSRVNICAQIPSEVLPPAALEYYFLVKEKGFTSTKGSPVLYVIDNEVTKVEGHKSETEFNLIAEWPSRCGHLQKPQENKGVVGLTLKYSTEPVCFEESQRLKEGAKVTDLWIETGFQYDLHKLIKDAPWQTRITLSLKRNAHDSTLPVSFLSEINSKHETFKGMVPNPERRVRLDEHLSIHYDFGKNLRLENINASSELYPSEAYDEIFTQTVREESNPIIRTPRAWIINNEEDVLRAMEGIQDYDRIVETHFRGDVFKQEGLKGINLEEMIKKVLPVMIDSMTDFVEH